MQSQTPSRNSAQDSGNAMQGPVSNVKRRKRDQYALVACLPCKTRKAKCDGCVPCECCQKRGAPCSYPSHAVVSQQHSQIPTARKVSSYPSPPVVEAFDNLPSAGRSQSTSSIQTILSTQPSNSEARVNHSTATTDGAISSKAGSALLPSRPGGTKHAADPTSFVHTFHLAKSSLEAHGVVQPETNSTKSPDLRRRFRLVASPYADFAQSAEVVLHLGFEKATDVLSDFVRMLYALYPCVDLVVVQEHLNYVFIDSVSRIGDDTSISDPIPISLAGLDILKAILGTTMLVNGSEIEPLALHLPRYLDWSCGKVVTGNGPEIHDAVMAMLLSLYAFYKSEMIKAWRLIGVAAKTCFELGLHLAPGEVSSPEKPATVPFTQRLFCCVYVWDHRCAFATGLPFTMQVADIHEKRFEVGASAPFLSAMIDYDCVNSEIFALLTRPNRNDVKEQRYPEFLEYKLLGIPAKFETLIAKAEAGGEWNFRHDARLMNNLRTTLLARVNHARTLLRISTFQSSRSVKDDPQSADVATSCACETISLCTKIIRESAVVPSLRSSNDFFICSALAAILLVVSQDPETYGEKCRQSFHEAIDILGTSASQIFSVAGRKLCFTFDQLKEIGERIKMPKDSTILTQRRVANDAVWQSLGLDQFSFPDDFLSFEDNPFNLFEMNEYV